MRWLFEQLGFFPLLFLHSHIHRRCAQAEKKRDTIYPYYTKNQFINKNNPPTFSIKYYKVKIIKCDLKYQID